MQLVKGCTASGPQDGSWNNPRYWGAIIKREAPKHSLDPVIVAALVLWESEGGNASAAEWEPNFYHRYIQGVSREKLGGHWPAFTHDSEYGELLERLGRAISYGHGQLMGQLARELGFDGDYFVELCDPEINIPLTCKALRRRYDEALKRNPGGDAEVVTRYALLGYNGGGNPKYPDNVLQFKANGKAAEAVR